MRAIPTDDRPENPTLGGQCSRQQQQATGQNRAFLPLAQEYRPAGALHEQDGHPHRAARCHQKIPQIAARLRPIEPRSPRSGSGWTIATFRRAAPWLHGVVVMLAACGTDAVGVESCRIIERARCVAADQCGLIGNLTRCQRFARDNCLHGTNLEQEASGVDVENCASAIEKAGNCAAKRGKNATPESCQDSVLEDSNAGKICDIVKEPERTPRCAFLAPEQEPDSKLDEPDGGR